MKNKSTKNEKKMKKEVVKFYSTEECDNNKNKFYIFGDNLINEGFGGQAIIRNKINTIGIPTKKLPSNSEGAFFNDDDYEYLTNRIENAIQEIVRFMKICCYDVIVFPKDGLGTGLADLQNKAPKCFEYLNRRLLEEFNFDNITGEIK